MAAPSRMGGIRCRAGRLLPTILPLVALVSLVIHGLSEGKEALPVQSALTRLGRALQQADAASQAPASAEQTANALSVRLAGRSLPKQPVKPALYSSFTCTGVKWGEIGNKWSCPYCRTCRFNNVCLNHTSLAIQFYQDPQDSTPLFYDFIGQPHNSFPADFINTAHVHIPPGKLNWAPTVVRQTRPPEAVTAASPVAVLASLNDFAYNFGHALFDFLFPVFNMLQLLGLYHPNFQLLLGTHQGSNPDISRHFIKPKQAERSLLRLITSQPARTLPELALQAAPGQELTCWASLVAGSGSLQTTMQRTRALPFRSAAFTNMGLAAEPDNSEAPLVTMLKKKGKRIIENADEVVAHLKAAFPWARFNTLDGDAVASMSIKEQLRAMSETSVLITPCGGTGTVLTFLQPGATAIVMNYWLPTISASMQMESLYYWNLEYLDLDYFAILPEDYGGTSDRPQCEKGPSDQHYVSQGPYIACNVRIANLQRIEHSVGTALRKWALQNNKEAPASANAHLVLAGQQDATQA